MGFGYGAWLDIDTDDLPVRWKTELIWRQSIPATEV
jgi:hypothetical protein